jgi:hypothetical protein
MAKKVTKNNKIEKPKQKQFKRIESSICETKCDQKCKEYEDYVNRLKTGKIGIGVLCKKG